MAEHTLHPLHKRRASRNLGLLVVLLALAAIIFGLAVVKIRHGDMMEAFDHQPRASMLPRDPDARPALPREPVADAVADPAADPATGAAATPTPEPEAAP